jgi:drug/metabolite transporter (DMT)-like permease
MAIGGLLLALGAGLLLSIPAVILESPSEGESLSTGANVAVQLATALGFLLVPIAIASRGRRRRFGRRCDGWAYAAFAWGER